MKTAPSPSPSRPLPNPSPDGRGATVGHGLLFALFTAIVFGVFPACVRAAYADGASVSFVLIVSTAARAILPWLFCLWTRKPIFASREDTKLAVTGGFFSAVSMIGNITALHYMAAPLTVIVMYTHTLMLLFFMAWRGEVKLDAATIITTFLALAGLSFALDVWYSAGSLSLPGVSLALIGALATMSRLYVYGHLTKTRNPAIVGTETFLMTLFFISFVAFFQTPHPPASPAGWGWMLLASLCLAAGTMGMFYSISLIGSFQFSLLMKLEPVCAALFSALLISEILHPRQYFGILMVVASLVAYQYMDYRRKNRAST